MYSHFSSTLKSLRLRENLTQTEVAKRLDINRSSYAMYERGERNPTIENLDKIARFYDVTTDYLLGNDDKAVQEWQDQGFMNEGTRRILNIMDVGVNYKFYSHDVPTGADFALRITGDSMEPFYKHDDIVLIKASVIVEPGQIGMFFLDGQGYIRMFQGGRLAATGPNGPTVEITQNSVYIPVGRVVGKM